MWVAYRAVSNFTVRLGIVNVTLRETLRRQ